MASSEITGRFLSLKGQNCTFHKITGVKKLVTEDGVDIVSLVRQGGMSGSGMSDEIAESLSNVMARLDVIENYLQNTPIGQPGPPGPAGPAGPPGPEGPEGPPGRDAKKVKLADLADVNLKGKEDGAILVYSEKEKGWVISID